jgi:hypothetical protein
MRFLKKYESWNDNVIDHSLFSSGRAKYSPQVSNGKIKYKTGNIAPYYFAEIYKKGDKFTCEIFKKKKDGDVIRLRNRVKKDLKTSHNYVREFLNQRLKRKLKNKNKDNVEKTAKLPEKEITKNVPFNRDFKKFIKPEVQDRAIVRRF